MISASHNPFQDNGIKFFSAHGTKLDDDWELSVETKLQQPAHWVTSEFLGKTKRLDDAAGRYIEFCKSTFDTNLTFKAKRIVIDAAHGAAYHIAPKVFMELGAEVISIGCAPDGMNINKDVGATHPQALIKAVQEHRADFGVALDGDADRLQLVDSDGRLFNGDELLYLLAMDRLHSGVNLQGVVGTLMTNKAVELALNQAGVHLHRANVGDRYVLESMLEHNCTLGGEGSGHLLMLDKHSTGDGLISALQVLQSCIRFNTSLSDLLKDVQLFPQCLMNVKVHSNIDWKTHLLFQNRMKVVQSELKEKGRVLIRPSGTEPVLRIMVEAEDESIAREFAKSLADALI